MGHFSGAIADSFLHEYNFPRRTSRAGVDDAGDVNSVPAFAFRVPRLTSFSTLASEHSAHTLPPVSSALAVPSRAFVARSAVTFVLVVYAGLIHRPVRLF